MLAPGTREAPSGSGTATRGPRPSSLASSVEEKAALGGTRQVNIMTSWAYSSLTMTRSFIFSIQWLVGCARLEHLDRLESHITC